VRGGGIRTYVLEGCIIAGTGQFLCRQKLLRRSLRYFRRETELAKPPIRRTFYVTVSFNLERHDG
jgi:hypothetical protein